MSKKMDFIHIDHIDTCTPNCNLYHISWSLLLFSHSVVSSLGNPTGFSTTGFPILHHLLELAQTYLLSQWCHPTISSSGISFSSRFQSFPASRSFQTSQLFTLGGQSIGISASTSVLPMNTQDWSPLGWTGWISLQSRGLSRVFSNTTVQKHQFFSAQLSLESSSHIHRWPLGNHGLD